jgi:N-acetylglucosaminyl-diphospho-decaprenol L-rhamnosyltransferase
VTATLAIVVVSYNVRDLLRACLSATCASLGRSPGLEVSIWVVDNASTDGSADMVAAEFPQVRLIANSTNSGFASGNNLVLRRLGFTDIRILEAGEKSSASRAADAGRGATLPDLVLLLNPDTEPLEDAIGQMASFLIVNPAAGGAGAQLVYPDGRFQHGAFCFPGLWQLWLDLFPPRPRRLLDSRLNGRYPRKRYAEGRPFAVDFVLGAALMVRSQAVAAAGLLDEGYFMYGEEVDWCWRFRRAGWPFYCVPSARVMHHGGASAQQFRARSFFDLWRSRRRLYGRFYGPVRRRLAGDIVRLGMWSEARRAQAAAHRGELSAAQLAERLEAAHRVAALYASEP